MDHLRTPIPALGLPIVPPWTGRDGPCRVLLLSAETDWCNEFKNLAKHLEFRIKRLDNAIDALVHFTDFDPHLFVIHEYDAHDLSLVDLCDALSVPRLLRPVVLLVTTHVPIPPGEDLAELGVDEVFDAEISPERYSTSLVQHFRLAVSQRRVLDRERDILDSLPDALMVLDSQLLLWKVNRAFAELFGLESIDALRRHLGQPLPMALRQTLGLQADENAGVPLSTALVIAMRNGKSGFECNEIIGSREHCLAGQITRLEGSEAQVLVTLHDVTDREQALMREARRERLATIGNLSVGVAHEIQNPNTFSRVNAANLRVLLDGLRPMLESLAAEKPGVKVGTLPLPSAIKGIQTAIEGIEMASNRIGTVLDTLKRFGQSSGDTIGSISVSTAISEAVVLTEHVVRGKAILKVEVPEDLPQVRAAGSELSQVFVNLIENAVSAFDSPGPQAPGNGPAEIRIHVDRMDDDEVVIAVSDNGPGIDEAVQALIFRPYYTTHAQGEGTGLGLSISSDIVHRFGGDLTVRSRRGQGASFLVVLKRAAAETSAGK